jgi:cation:H+ antiporter
MLAWLLLTLLSFILLFAGAELLVRGGAGIALRLGLSALVVGLTVVAYGTSTPELVVSVKAAWAGQPGIAVGNVVGSNIFNIAVILGVAALIRPVRSDSTAVNRDAPVMVAVTLGGMAVLWDGNVARWEGLLLVAASVVYTVWIIRQARKEKSDDDEGLRPLGMVKAVLFIAAGLVVLVIGSRLLVVNAVEIARALGVSESVIGLTIIAAGTSMPELATSAVGALRGHSDIALGNVIGSNIFNILFVLGLAAVVHPIQGMSLRAVDQAFLLGTAVVLAPMMWTGRRVGRVEGGILLVMYAAYLWLMWPAK